MLRPFLGFDVHFFTNLTTQKYMDQKNKIKFRRHSYSWCGVFYEKKILAQDLI
jgi:hypothetical protein